MMVSRHQPTRTNFGIQAVVVVVAEWLRRWTRNPLGSPRAGSNPANNACVFLSTGGGGMLEYVVVRPLVVCVSSVTGPNPLTSGHQRLSTSTMCA